MSKNELELVAVTVFVKEDDIFDLVRDYVHETFEPPKGYKVSDIDLQDVEAGYEYNVHLTPVA